MIVSSCWWMISLVGKRHDSKNFFNLGLSLLFPLLSSPLLCDITTIIKKIHVKIENFISEELKNTEKVVRKKWRKGFYLISSWLQIWQRNLSTHQLVQKQAHLHLRLLSHNIAPAPAPVVPPCSSSKTELREKGNATGKKKKNKLKEILLGNSGIAARFSKARRIGYIQTLPEESRGRGRFWVWRKINQIRASMAVTVVTEVVVLVEQLLMMMMMTETVVVVVVVVGRGKRARPPWFESVGIHGRRLLDSSQVWTFIYCCKHFLYSTT